MSSKRRVNRTYKKEILGKEFRESVMQYIVALLRNMTFTLSIISSMF